MTESYTFDPAATDSANYDYHGVYHTSAPSVVQASIEDLHWHADKSFVAIINGEPPQKDIYEAGASRITLDSPPELAELLDIWIFQLTLRGDGDNLSDASLLLTPPELSQWSEARLLMIGESSTYSGLDPMPAVMITASLTELGTRRRLPRRRRCRRSRPRNWQANFGSMATAMPITTATPTGSTSSPGSGSWAAACRRSDLQPQYPNRRRWLRSSWRRRAIVSEGAGAVGSVRNSLGLLKKSTLAGSDSA